MERGRPWRETVSAFCLVTGKISRVCAAAAQLTLRAATFLFEVGSLRPARRGTAAAPDYRVRDGVRLRASTSPSGSDFATADDFGDEAAVEGTQ
jgi:hypothetical protein